MENASEAIKMAGAIIIFTMALAVVMNMFTSARAAADGVMNRNDYTKTYYAADETAKDTNMSPNNFYLAYQKIVGVDEVISTMYSYREEGTTILFYTAEGVGTDLEGRSAESIYKQIDDTKIKPVVLYFSEANNSALAKSSLNLQSFTYKDTSTTPPTYNNALHINRAIFGLSSSDELMRQEPWTGSDTATKLFLDDLIAGRTASDKEHPNNSHRWDTTSTALYGTYTSSNTQDKYSINGRNVPQLSYGFDLPDLNIDMGDGDIRISDNATSIRQLTRNNKGFFGFNNNARFIERIGEYDYKSRNIDTSTGGFINEGTVMLSNDEKIEAEATSTKKRVIQFIYLE